jgi:hypothetical protein
VVVGDLERRLVELRFIDGIQKVEHVPYQSGDQFWVRFDKPLDFAKLEQIVKKHNCTMVRFANIPSRLPRALAEMVWDGVSHVITRNISGWEKFKSSLGFEPDGIAKIASDLHGPYEIFMATDEEGVQILYELLGLKYVAPPPPSPPKPTAPAKPSAPATLAHPAAPTIPRPTTTAPQPASVARPSSPAAQHPTAGPPAPVKLPEGAQASAAAPSTPEPATKPAAMSQTPGKKEEKPQETES